MRVYVQGEESATQQFPSEIDTFYRLHADANGVFNDAEALRMYVSILSKTYFNDSSINYVATRLIYLLSCVIVTT